MGGDDGRLVHLTLVTPSGRMLGMLPPLQVALDWENDIPPVVAAARAAYGLDVTVLRMRWVEGFEAGGPIGYLAECAAAPDGMPLEAGEPESDQPLRAPWARPGGPAATLRWADGVLAGAGRIRRGAAVQHRTWGLSGIWRLETASGAVWCKQVPGFFAHEGAVIGWLNRVVPGAGPELVGAEGDRLITVDIPDSQLWDPPIEVRQRSLRTLLGVQAVALDRIEELLALGVPDRRPAWLSERIAATAAAWRGELARAEQAALDRFVDGLPERFAEVAACGVPDTLVHGDFHSGNVLTHDAGQTIIDWTDAQIGHPALDLAAFLVGLPDEEAGTLRDQWADHWRTVVPACEPERAAELMQPVAAFGQATAYDMFIRLAEPDERIWHAKYALRWLRRAIATAETPVAAGGSVTAGGSAAGESAVDGSAVDGSAVAGESAAGESAADESAVDGSAVAGESVAGGSVVLGG